MVERYDVGLRGMDVLLRPSPYPEKGWECLLYISYGYPMYVYLQSIQEHPNMGPETTRPSQVKSGK